MSEPIVSHVPDRSCFEVVVDGRRAGLAQYVEQNGQRIFVHTEVGEEYEGRGLAGVLVGRALDQTRAAGLRVVPACPYVKGFVDRHEQYADLADPVTPAAREIARAHEATRAQP